MDLKGIRSISFIFLLIFLLGIISADFQIKLKSECDSENRVFALSSSTNAHGGLVANSPFYNYVLCGDFPGAISNCEGKSPIIRLSAETNAHAEIASESNYLINVCYGDLVCISQSEGSCSGDYSIPVLSLSSSTNAHIGGFNDYPIKICCSALVYPPFTSSENTSYILNIFRTDPWYSLNQKYHQESKYETIVYELKNISGSPLTGAEIYIYLKKDGIVDKNWINLYEVYGISTGIDGKLTINCTFSEDFPTNGQKSCTAYSTGASGVNFNPSPVISTANWIGAYTEEKAIGTFAGYRSPESNEISFIVEQATFIPQAYWRDKNGNEIPENKMKVLSEGGIEVMMVFDYTGMNSGNSAIFEIYEDDLLSDDKIRTDSDALTAYADASGKTTTIWEITKTDLGKGRDLSGDEFQFYFLAKGAENTVKSENLIAEIIPFSMDLCESSSGCGTYSNPTECESDPCFFATTPTDVEYGSSCNERTGETVNGYTDCYYKRTCSCAWVEKNGEEKCINNPGLETDGACVPLGNNPPVYKYHLGVCSEFRLETGDTCEDDGFLDYGYFTEGLDWGENSYSFETEATSFQTPDGLWHIPNPDYESCEECKGPIGCISSIPCPTAIALSFFTIGEIISTLVVIILIYYFIFWHKKKKNKLKKKRKK